MKKLSVSLLVFLVVWFLSFPVYSESYSEKTNQELLQMLEKNSIELRNCVKDLENQLNKREIQLKEKEKLLTELNQQLQKTNESYKSLKREQTIDKIKIGAIGFSTGFVVGGTIFLMAKK